MAGATTDLKKLTADTANKDAEGFDDLDKVNGAPDAKDQEKILEDVLRKYAGKPVALAAAQTLATGKARGNAPEAEARAAADRYVGEAAAYGPELEGNAALQTARGLLSGGHAKPALELARRAEKLLPADAPPAQAAPVLKVLAAALKAGGPADEAAKASARLADLDKNSTKGSRRTPSRSRPSRTAGRKKKTDRVVLVELFTGTQCPPCVATDVAFDALLKTYKPGQVALLQYHLHIPRPDPLTTADAEARGRRYYGDAIDPGTPTHLRRRQARPRGRRPGHAGNAKEGYDDLTRAVDQRAGGEPGARGLS